MKSARTTLYLSIGFSIIVALGIMIVIFINDGFNWGLLGVVGVSVVVILLTTLPFMKALGGSEVKNGIAAEATILKMWDTGTSINDNPLVGFLLEVRPPNQAAYQVETKKILGRLQVGLVQPGLSAEVKIDPKNPQKVDLETVHTGQQPDKAADRMEALEELHTRHLISEREYEEKRQEILKSL